MLGGLCEPSPNNLFLDPLLLGSEMVTYLHGSRNTPIVRSRADYRFMGNYAMSKRTLFTQAPLNTSCITFLFPECGLLTQQGTSPSPFSLVSVYAYAHQPERQL